MGNYMVVTSYAHQPWTVSTLSGKYCICGQGGGISSSNYYCETIDTNPFSACMRSSVYGMRTFITEGCYNGLTEGQKSIARSRALGVCKNSFYEVRKWNGSDRICFLDSSIIKCFNDTCYAIRPDLAPDPCAGVVCEPECVGTDRYATACEDGKCVRGELMEANSTECGYVPPPIPKQRYVKFDVPYLDMLPGIPYEPWMWIPPGFKIVEEP